MIGVLPAAIGSDLGSDYFTKKNQSILSRYDFEQPMTFSELVGK